MRNRFKAVLAVVGVFAATLAPSAAGAAEAGPSVQVVDGVLVVQGTSGDDDVRIRSGANDDEYVIRTFDAAGERLAKTTVSDISGMHFKMGRGDDYVFLSGLPIFGDLNFEGGPGNDYFLDKRSYVIGDMNLNMGSGTDRVKLDSNIVTRNLTFRGQNGSDDISAFSADVGGDFKIYMGAGKARAYIVNTFVVGDFVYRAPDGDVGLEIVGGELG